MNQNLFMPLALIVIIAMAFYILYGDSFNPGNTNLQGHIRLCEQYRQAPAGKYPDKEIRMLVSEADYLMKNYSEKFTDKEKTTLTECIHDLESRQQ